MLRKCRWFLLFIFCFSVSFQLFAANPEIDPKLVKGKLKNGLTYYIYPSDFPEGEAVYRLFLKAGSMVETDSQKGLAHFLEHMAFNGTTHFPKDSLIRFLEGTGARFGKDLNAHTSYNETVYKLQLPSKDKQLVTSTMTILADWAGGMVLDSAEIEKERGVVLSEWLSRKGAGEETQRAFLNELLNNSRYAERTVIGDTAVIKNFSHDELRAYYRDWYDPAFMAVAVVGDVDPEMIEQLIKEKFGDLRSARKKRLPQYSIDNYKSVEVKRVINDAESKIELNLIQLGQINAPVRKAKDYYAYLEQSMLNQLTKRRFSELSFKGPAYSKGSLQISGFLDTKKVVLATVELNPGKMDSSLIQYAHNLEQLYRYGFDSNEIATVKTNYKNLLKRKLESKRPVSSISIMEEIYADFFKGQPMITAKGEYELFQETIGQIDSISLVKKLQSLKAPNKIHYLLTGHDKGKDSLPSSTRILEVFEQARKSVSIPRYNKQVNEMSSLLDEMPIEGTILREDTIPELEATRMVLSNGATVLIKPSIKSDEKITVTGFRKGGLYAVDPDEYVSGLFATNVIALSGAGNHSRESLSHYLNGNSASVRFLIDKTRTGIAGSSDVKDMETLFQLIHLKWTEPKVSSDIFKLVQEKAIEGYRNKNRTEASEFRRELSYLMSGKDYTTRELTDTVLLTDLQEDKLLPVFDKAFGTADRFTFIITTDLPKKDIKELVLLYLGGLPEGEADTTYQYRRAPLAEKDQLLARKSGDSPKATVSLIFQQDTVAKRHNLFSLKMDIVTAVLRMKLLQELREDLGMVYSVGVAGSATPYPSGLARQSISFNSDPANVELLIKRIEEQLNAMATQPDSFIKELRDVKTNLIKEMELNRQKDSFWSSFIRNSIFNNDTDWNYVSEFEKTIESISAAEIAEMVSSTFLDSPVIQAVLYPKEQLNEQLNNSTK